MKTVPKIIFILSVFIFLLSISLCLYTYRSNPVFRYYTGLLSLSAGDRYYSKLQIWYMYAKKADWLVADKLALSLDPADTEYYRHQHQPSELNKSLVNLTAKSKKTVEDWLAIAQLQSQLGNTPEALKSISQARLLDPIRDDIEKLYFQLSSSK